MFRVRVDREAKHKSKNPFLTLLIAEHPFHKKQIYNSNFLIYDFLCVTCPQEKKKSSKNSHCKF